MRKSSTYLSLKRQYKSYALFFALAVACNTNKPLNAAEALPQPQVQYNLDALPEKTRETLERIKAAARTGDIEELRAAIEWNELPPEIEGDETADPISKLKKSSHDGTAQDMMAVMLNIFERGFITSGGSNKTGSTSYIWPYFAEISLTKLKPNEEVDLNRIATPGEIKAMKESGSYTGYVAIIGADGTWHSFRKKK